MNATAAATLRCRLGTDPVLTRMQVKAAINDLLAEVEVTQQYRNSGQENIEAVYTFPLPLDGVLLGFEFELGNRRHVGRFVASAEGEREYEKAMEEGDAAVLLEQAGPGLYTASVGNLQPGETAAVRFRYGLLLRWNGNLVRLSMPTTVAPRYGDPAKSGLQPHQIPEAGLAVERDFCGEVSVRGKLRDARFNSPTHATRVSSSETKTVIRLEDNASMDRDFVIEARATVAEPACAVLVQDHPCRMAMASFRPEIPCSTHARRRSVRIVVDCSGSMAGDSIAQARLALERILDALRTGDHFEIIAFGSRNRALFGCCTTVSEVALAKARCFVRALDADMGGTEIRGALDSAYAVQDRSGNPRDVLLITDGQSWDQDELLARARRSGHRIFAVGVGSAAAEDFLRGLSDRTGGATELVSPREDMAGRIHRHFQRMYAPGTSSVRVDWPPGVVRHHPQSIEAAFAGDTLHTFAWFDRPPTGRAVLELTLEDGSTVQQVAEISVAPDCPASGGTREDALPPTIARMAAAQRIAATDPDDPVGCDLALRYQLLSRWTSCVAVHVRAPGRKSVDLPTLVRVPQAHAVGSHGMGSVYQSSRASFDEGPTVAEHLNTDFIMDDPTPRTRRKSPRMSGIRRAPASAMKPIETDPPHSRRKHSSRPPNLAPSGSPARLVQQLNLLPMAPCPTLDDLRDLGLPGPVAKAMRALNAQGADEKELVIAFLYWLARSSAGSHLERHVRRAIFKAARTLSLPEDLPRVVEQAVEACPAWSLCLPNRGPENATRL